MKRWLLGLAAVLLLASPWPTSAAETAYEWNVADIYPSEHEWMRDYKAVKNALPKLAAFEGKLDDAKTIAKLFALNEQTARKLEKLSLYAHLKRDINIEDETAARLGAKVEALAAQYAAKTAFIEPELLALPERTLRKLQKTQTAESVPLLLP